MGKPFRVISSRGCGLVAIAFILRVFGPHPALAADGPPAAPTDRGAAEDHTDDRKTNPDDEGKSQSVTSQPTPPPAEAVAKSQVGRTSVPIEDGLGAAGAIIGGVGVFAAVAGVLFNLKANSMIDDMETTVDAYTPDAESRQKTYKTLAWVSYGVGAACLATGGVLIGLAINRSRPAGKTDISLLPTIGPGQAGVVVGGGF